MSTEAVADAGGVEVWCGECGSVAYFRWDDGDGYGQENRKAEAAAALHDDQDCAPIWLDGGGEPTTTDTGLWAGGCSDLQELAAQLSTRATSSDHETFSPTSTVIQPPR